MESVGISLSDWSAEMIFYIENSSGLERIYLVLSNFTLAVRLVQKPTKQLERLWHIDQPAIWIFTINSVFVHQGSLLIYLFACLFAFMQVFIFMSGYWWARYLFLCLTIQFPVGLSPLPAGPRSNYSPHQFFQILDRHPLGFSPSPFLTGWESCRFIFVYIESLKLVQERVYFRTGTVHSCIRKM